MTVFLENSAICPVTNSGSSGKLRSTPMTGLVADGRTSFDPLGASGLLLAVLGICVGAGAGIGAAAGSLGIGVAVGSVIGIPAAIIAVYLAYRRAF
jgi:hypothetical protein